MAATKTKPAKAKPASAGKPEKADALKSAAHSFPKRATGEADVLPIARRTAKLLSGALRVSLQPLAEERLSVESGEPRIVAHDEWLAEQTGSIGLAFYQLPPMKGRMALRMSHDLIAALVDAFFGGSIARGKAGKNGFSPSDLRLMHRIGQNCTDNIGAAWAQMGPFRCVAAGFADDPEEAKIATGDAPILIQPFTLTYPDKVTFTLECIYPVEMIQSGRDVTVMAHPEESMAIDPAWRQALGGAIAETFLPVRSILARPTMTMNELANLREGDVIPIPHAHNLQLLVGDRPFARGTIGEKNGLAAFRIEHFEQGLTK